MKTLGIIAAATACALAGSPVLAQTIGTDIIRKPSDWRGTLLEGTDTLVATNDYGQALFVQVDDTVAPTFAPAAMTAERLANEFKRLCIDTGFDQARLAGAAAGSSFRLQNRQVTIAGRKDGPALVASVWHSPEARVQIWGVEASALKNRQTLSRWRNGATSGPFSPGRTQLPSCNVTVMSTGFDGVEPFVAAMNRILGAEPSKSVVKRQWADGHWQVKGTGGAARVSYSMVDLDRTESLLHVAITPVGAEKAK
ncbi:hypothetical protein E2493_03230 [Sphingomonas parva]|uniref:Uncharacterized protein n=1 Tax=Sphingomonas parva TaxID=2555898 RepID=A0A4Y8ZXB2_9SPHN|nr:hypothetical protein [Sphingomonas parva]TFI59855.1 hypothetical protein E2493_03230 [Sphingomonas parva]